MNYFRAMLAGAMVWLLVIVTFTVLTYVPGVENSMVQGGVVTVLMVLYATAGSFLYYRNVVEDHGLKVGIWASGTALLLDVLITVPFFEVPNGGGYAQFFTAPLLWVLVIINIATFYLFGRRNAAALKARQTH